MGIHYIHDKSLSCITTVQRFPSAGRLHRIHCTPSPLHFRRTFNHTGCYYLFIFTLGIPSLREFSEGCDIVPVSTLMELLRHCCSEFLIRKRVDTSFESTILDLSPTDLAIKLLGCNVPNGKSSKAKGIMTVQLTA